MNLRSPAENYIKYLLVHPDKYSNEVIEKTLGEFGIYFLGKEYLEKLRGRLVTPEVFRPLDMTHPASLRFLIREGIRTLFHPTQATKTALRILSTPRAKEFTEAMLLSHAPPAAIAARMPAFRATTEAVEEYKKHFWNIEALTATQMRMLLSMELDQNVGESDPAVTRDMKRALKNASYRDPRKLAADLPYTPLTAVMSQMRMGVMPNRLELSEIMKGAQAMASLRLYEAILYGGPKDSMVALNFSTVVKHMTEALETVVKPDENLRKDLQAIALRTDAAPVPSIHQLSGGNHTVDMQPASLEEPDEPVENKSGSEEGSAGGGPG
jgi:hypothetical protein